MNHPNEAWRSVRLYGVDHSPWVQGVLLALRYHKIPVSLTSYPLSIKWCWRYGLVFPALQLADGSRHLDSFKMYELMEACGFHLGIDQSTTQDRLSFQAELEQLFSIYALGRCISGKKWAFIKAWSVMSERPSTYQGAVCRALLSSYFWVLIQIGIYVARRRREAAYDLDQIESYLMIWNERLRDHQWLTGDEIGFLDFALWGHMQCMTSGLTDELLSLLRDQPHLMSWVKRLSQLDISDISPYTQRLIDQSVGATEADPCQTWFLRVIFWCVWIISLCLWPLTLVFILISLLRRFRNPARSGAINDRYSSLHKDAVSVQSARGE